MDHPPRLLALVAALALSCGGRAETPYGPCRAAATCNDATELCVAFRNRADGSSVPLCTHACSTNAECPDNGVCVETLAGGYRSLCMQRCRGDSDCTFAGGFCATVRPDDRACVP